MVKSWIEWTRENVNTTAGYPKITSLGITGYPSKTDPEYISRFHDDDVRREQLAAFIEALAPDPAAFAPRFTALHFYHSLFSHAKELIADPASLVLWGYYDDNDLESLKAVAETLQNDLALLVRALPVEQCPADWLFFRWEDLKLIPHP